MPIKPKCAFYFGNIYDKLFIYFVGGKKMNAYLGIDVGGTKIAAGIFDENKKLVCSFKGYTWT